MNSILPSIFQSSSVPVTKEPQTVYHYHKLEIIVPKPSETYAVPKELNRVEKIKAIIADALIILGAIMGSAAGIAITLQTAGITAPIVLILSNLMMPAVAAILTGFHMSKNDLKTTPQLRIPTGVPGLTFSS